MHRIWRPLFPLALLMFASVPTFGAPPEVVEVPRGDASSWKEIKAQPGRLLILKAEPASKWLLVDEDAADLKEFEGGKLAAFVAQAGRHKLIVTAPDGTPARIEVVVGGAPPVPPKPPGPKPVDSLKEKIAAAVAADPLAGEARKKAVADLAELYRQVAAKVVPSETVSTRDELLDRARTLSAAVIGPDVLVGVRKVVGEELAALLPVESALTAEQRAALKQLFERLAVILDAA